MLRPRMHWVHPQTTNLPDLGPDLAERPAADHVVTIIERGDEEASPGVIASLLGHVDLENVGADELNHLVEELVDRRLAAGVGGI